MGKHHDTDAQTSGVTSLTSAEMSMIQLALYTYADSEMLALATKLGDAVQMGASATLVEHAGHTCPMCYTTFATERELSRLHSCEGLVELHKSMNNHPAGSRL